MATLSSEAIRTFGEWNIGKVRAGFLKFQLVKGGKIGITELGQEGVSWKEITESLDDTEPCWLAHHFQYTGENVKRSKTILLQWIPSKSSTRDKMQYAMWSRGMKTSLSGINKTIHAGNKMEADEESILEHITKFSKQY